MKNPHITLCPRNHPQFASLATGLPDPHPTYPCVDRGRVPLPVMTSKKVKMVYEELGFPRRCQCHTPLHLNRLDVGNLFLRG
jgi:hypothetical protein